MEKIKEVFIKSLIQIAAGVMIAAISVAWNNKRSDNKTLRRDVDHIRLTKADRAELKDKVDKKEFAEFKNEHDDRHDRDAIVTAKFFSWLKEEMGELRKDVREIKNKG